MSTKFSQLIDSPKPTLVDFYADWCGPCHAMKPILEEVKRRVGDAVTIIKVDVDRNQQAAAAYGIQSIPTLILFKAGKIVWRQTGVIQAGALEQVLRSNL
jgi:thioredoxin 1